LQRLVALAAVQFILFEPEGRVELDGEFRAAADKMIEILLGQLKTLKTKKSDW
jgi:hypothetical protein